jgi:hypothetical protein
MLAVGALVCTAASLAGDAAQDLKTGYLVGATPWKQQLAEFIGVLVPVGAIAGLIYVCNDVYGFSQSAAHPNAMLAPQANIMKVLVEGIVDGHLPWSLIICGMAIAVVVELLGIHALPFAVGLYLPLSLSTPIMIGALVRWVVERLRPPVSESHDPGVLAASGLVAGQGLVGVFFVLLAAGISLVFNNPRFVVPVYEGDQVVVASQPASGPPVGEAVVSQHFYPWLTTVMPGVLKPEYGLPPLAREAGPFKGENAIRWETLLPMLPFGLVTVWLIVVARRTLPIEAAEANAPPPDGAAPPAQS